MKNLVKLIYFKRLISTFVATLFITSMGWSQGLDVYGYADFEAYWENPGGNGSSQVNFDNHHFNLVLMGSLSNNLFADAEVEYEHGGSETQLEYGYIGYAGIKNMRIMAGKFIVPFGRFNKDLHATWINKMIDRPNGFKDILPQTYSDFGLWVSGAAAMSEGNRFTYDVFLVNGLMGSDGGGIRGMRNNYEDKYPGGGSDNNKSIGTRLGLDFAPSGFDVGLSVMTGNYSDTPDENLSLTLTGVDLAYHYEGIEVRGELVHASQEVSDGDNLSKTGGYMQAAYKLAPKVEPVVRWSSRNMPGDGSDKSRFSLGINYYLSSASSVRINYHINNEKVNDSDNNVFATQFNMTF